MTSPTTAWTTELKRRGITPLPGSSAVPVELYGLLPDGHLAHFRCRGTAAVLRVYAAGDFAVAVGVHEGVGPELPVTGEVWLAADDVLGSATGRTVLLRDPLAEASIDGRARFGWARHEAGLLRREESLPLLAELLDDLFAARLPAAV